VAVDFCKFCLDIKKLETNIIPAFKLGNELIIRIFACENIFNVASDIFKFVRLLWSVFACLFQLDGAASKHFHKVAELYESKIALQSRKRSLLVLTSLHPSDFIMFYKVRKI
jgi:hypothetical protein